MPRRHTRTIRYICLPEKRIREMEEIVAAWPFETKEFMRARLNQYQPPLALITWLRAFMRWVWGARKREDFTMLRDPEIITDWQKRFEVSGQSSPRKAWNAILQKEISAKDKSYLVSLLDRELNDVHLPEELSTIFNKVYRAHIR